MDEEFLGKLRVKMLWVQGDRYFPSIFVRLFNILYTASGARKRREWFPQTKRNRLLLEDDPAEIGCLGNRPRDSPTTDVLFGNCRVITLCFFTVTDTFALLYVKQTFPVLHENEIAFGQRYEYP